MSSNGINYTQVINKSAGQWIGLQEDIFAVQSARYIRVNGLYSSNSIFHLQEVLVYEASSTTKLNTNLVVTNNYTATNLTNGTAYQFYVVAVDKFNNPSEDSAVVSATPSITSEEAITALSILTEQSEFSTAQVNTEIQSFSFVADGGAYPYTWEISKGRIPEGLRFNSETGELTGIPLKGGTFEFTVEVTDSIGDKAAKEYIMEIESPFVIVSEGNFKLNETEFYPYGINYTPQYGYNPPLDGGYVSGSADYWLNDNYYDAGAIESDLAILESMGINCITINASTNLNTGNAFSDLLSRCEAHNLKAVISFSSVNIFEAESSSISSLKDTISSLALSEKEIIFAYNISFCTEEEFNIFKDAAKSKWIQEYYPEVLDENEIAVIKETLESDASFKNYLETEVSDKIAEALQSIKTADHNHLITSTQEISMEAPLIELKVIASNIDFMSVKTSSFKTSELQSEIWGSIKAIESYCRYISNNKPVLWSKAESVSCADFIDGMIASGLNGAMFEMSEIINIDGTLTLDGTTLQNRASDAVTVRSSYGEAIVESVSLNLSSKDILTYANNAWSALSQESDYLMTGVE